MTSKTKIFITAVAGTLAMEKTELCIMRRVDFQAFLLKYPVISLKILQEFSRRLERTEIQVSSL